ncbi:MAG TPA: alpha/beta hydrolase [Bacteroidota bacterium]|nr:alpha/beta hydrolase [Bacteroidota bacterium]
MKHLGTTIIVLLLLRAGADAGAPEQAKTGYVQTGRYSLYYEDSGKGEPLILIHAALLDRRMWDGQVPLFSRWARVIRYDERNHGLSHGLPDSFSYHEDLNRIMEALGIQKARLLGCALGAAIAVDFALVHPEKVSALVLESPLLSGYEFKDPVVLENQKKQSEAAARKDMTSFIEFFQRSWTDGPRRTPDVVDRDVRAKILQMCRSTLSKPEPDNIAVPLDPPSIGRLGSIHVPTLVVLGDYDQAGTEEIAGLITRGIPAARKVVIKGAGHMVNMEKPEEFNEIVGEFLSR